MLYVSSKSRPAEERHPQGTQLKLGAPEQEEAGTNKQKPDAPLIGADANVFNLIGIASRTLRGVGMLEEAEKMNQRIIFSNSYQEALNIISEYVNFT